jgi:hypothetical protein
MSAFNQLITVDVNLTIYSSPKELGLELQAFDFF